MRTPATLLLLALWAGGTLTAPGASAAGPAVAASSGAGTLLAPAPADDRAGMPPEALTVDALVARALAEHPELRAARAAVEAARGRLHQAGLRPNPTLDLSVARNLVPAMPDNSQAIGFTWPLDLGGRRPARLGVAAAELALRAAEVDERARRLAAEVRLKAGELLAARRDLEVTEALLAASRETLRLVRERVREGAAPALDAALMGVEVARLEAQRATRAGRVEVLQVQLAPLAGLPPVPSIRVVGDLVVPPPIPARERALVQALEARPDLRMAMLDVDLARARVERERAEGRYDVHLMARYTREETGFDVMGINGAGRLRPIQETFHMLMLGVSVLLPVRHRNEGNVAAALAELEAARRRLEATELVVRQEVAAAYAAHEAATRAAEIYRTDVLEAARRNLEVVRESHALGRLTLLDLVAEQRRLLELETGYTETLRQRWEARVEIQRAVGLAEGP